MVKKMDFRARMGRFNKWFMLFVYPFYLYLVRFCIVWSLFKVYAQEVELHNEVQRIVVSCLFMLQLNMRAVDFPRETRLFVNVPFINALPFLTMMLLCGDLAHAGDVCLFTAITGEDGLSF